jgi:hypothetical protein
VVAVLLWIATAASAALAVLAAREWTWGCVSDPLTAGLVPLVHSSGTVLPHADVGSGPTTDDAWLSSTPFAFSIMLLIAGGLCWPSDRLGPTADEGKRTHDELPHVSRKDEAGCHGPGAAVVVEAVAGKMDFCNRLELGWIRIEASDHRSLAGAINGTCAREHLKSDVLAAALLLQLAKIIDDRA